MSHVTCYTDQFCNKYVEVVVFVVVRLCLWYVDMYYATLKYLEKKINVT